MINKLFCFKSCLSNKVNPNLDVPLEKAYESGDDSSASQNQRLESTLDPVRVLAEQNVSLQREVCSLSERETESTSVITCSEQQLTLLRDNLSALENKYSEAQQVLSCFKRNFIDKDEECKELHKLIPRLVRTCSEQEKTIAGLREAFSGELDKESVDSFDKHVRVFLTGVELAIKRRKVEFQTIEIHLLCHENVCLLNRLKHSSEEIGALSFNLDKEIWSRICCLLNQGLPMLGESARLCSQLLEFIKEEASQLSATNVKGKVSSVLQEKTNSLASRFELCTNGDESRTLSDLTSEETLRYQLKAESLVTSLLRENLYSKESEAEELHAELAAAIRGNDILRYEVQNARRTLLCQPQIERLRISAERRKYNLRQQEPSCGICSEG